MSSLTLIVFCLAGNAMVILVLGGLITEVKAARAELAELRRSLQVPIAVRTRLREMGADDEGGDGFVRPDLDLPDLPPVARIPGADHDA
jgi:hypothetical protein